MMASAARSLTERPGLRNSALPRMVQPVASEAARRRMSGVLPIVSMKPSRKSMYVAAYSLRHGREPRLRQTIRARWWRSRPLGSGARRKQLRRQVAKPVAAEVGGGRSRCVDLDDGAADRREGGAEVVLRLDAEQPRRRRIDPVQGEIGRVVRRLA